MWFFEAGASLGEDIEVALRLAEKVLVEPGASGGCVISHPWGRLELKDLSPAAMQGLGALAAGWLAPADVWSLGEREGVQLQDAVRVTAELFWVIEQWPFLFRLRLSQKDVVRVDIEMIAAKGWMRPGKAGPPGARLSRFAYVREASGALVLESALSPYRLILQDARAAQVILGIAGGPVDLDEEWLCQLLHAAGMTEASEQPAEVGIAPELAELAEFHDLLFHRRSRFGFHDRDFGGTFPFLGMKSPLAPVPAREGTSIVLPRPAPVAVRDLSLTQALEQRSSQRDYASRPMRLDELAEFLFRCARVRGVFGPLPDAGMPYEVTDRPYPTGGGAYDLEIYVLANKVARLRRGIYHYAAERHALCAIPAEELDLNAILLGAQRASGAARPPQVLLQITSRFGRLAWKYRSISYATSLKNVGVLYQTMYLVATSMGLAACGLGSGNDIVASRVLDLPGKGELLVGDFMLGRPLGRAATAAGRQGLDSWRSVVEPDWGRQ